MDPSTSFPSAAANTSGHAVSVLVLVEDSQTMLGKWDDVRHRYLPALLHGLRVDNKTNPQFRIWWFTSSPAFTPMTTTVTTLADYNNLPNLSLGRHTDTLISTGTIRRCVNVYLASGKQRRTNQHLIIIAASPLLTGSEGPGPVQAGIDPWVGTALALCQEEIHLHLIVGPANESRSFRDLFSRTRFAQTLSEIPPWFEVDATRFSILISGRALQQPQQGATSMRTTPTSVPLLDTRRSSPEIPLSPTTTSPLSSPAHPISPTSSRRSSVSTTSPPRPDERPALHSRSTTDTLGLVGYLQRMHGLTKKRSYGAKPTKRTATLAEGHVPGRPILPRLDLSAPYPRPPVRSSETVIASPGSSTAPSSQRSSPTAERPSVDDRLALNRGSWQPLSPSSASGQVPDSTAAALRSLEAMAPRLTEFHTPEHPSASTRSPTGRDIGRGAQLMQALARRDATSADLSIEEMHALSSASAHDMGATDMHQRPAMLGRSLSIDHVSYYNMMASTSQAPSPLPSPSLTAPESSAESSEDQPFIVTPEYEAFVAARFEEAVRSGAMQASMTSNVPGTLSAPAVLTTGEVMGQAPEMQTSMYAGQHPGTQGTGHQTALAFDSSAYSAFPGQSAEIGGQWGPDHGYVQDPSLYGGPSTGAWHSR
ncbi:uncharacterized protein B0H18DRAFT_1034332 [Fomitopsis serialis]|uniref:uncharacterized protein n=1 Tax=Fomitopsis serialis TaxID=139415 RepID=UPI0020076414|nr:uncharacterized protein B0H18DRAFT_1034332 [Neoantrodia serialis]KAH9917485.1 hypothetical protein B0H18DRAFT_1034332 [Neoantrodia serialis]